MTISDFDQSFFLRIERKHLKDILESRSHIDINRYLSPSDHKAIEKSLRYGNIGNSLEFLVFVSFLSYNFSYFRINLFPVQSWEPFRGGS